MSASPLNVCTENVIHATVLTNILRIYINVSKEETAKESVVQQEAIVQWFHFPLLTTAQFTVQVWSRWARLRAPLRLWPLHIVVFSKLRGFAQKVKRTIRLVLDDLIR